MQGRSRMAALTLVVGFVLALGIPTRAEDKLVVGKIQVDLRIAGLTQKGCDVEIKPGHAGCKFKPVTKHIASQGKLVVELKDVEIRSPDRDCSFAITIKEEGQTKRTNHRGLRIPTSGAGSPTQVPSLTCFLNSPSKLARAEAERTQR